MAIALLSDQVGTHPSITSDHVGTHRTVISEWPSVLDQVFLVPHQEAPF